MATIIYTLKDPRSGEVRYVGKTSGSTQVALSRRVSRHVSWKDQSHRSNWLRQLEQEGLRPVGGILCVVPDSMWVTAEVMFIEYYRQAGCKLTNTTHGGEGCSGNHKPKSPEHRAKLAAILRSSADKRRGVPLSAEHRAKIGIKTAERNRQSRSLSPEQEAEVRAKYIPFDYSHSKLAKEYGVSIGCIRRVLERGA